jgi:hypothetical protein
LPHACLLAGSEGIMDRYALRNGFLGWVTLPGRRSWVALCAGSALLFGLFAVQVHEAARDAQRRRVAASQRADAQWRCNALHGRRYRDACLKELDAPVGVVTAEAAACSTALGMSCTVVLTEPPGH